MISTMKKRRYQSSSTVTYSRMAMQAVSSSQNGRNKATKRYEWGNVSVIS